MTLFLVDAKLLKDLVRKPFLLNKKRFELSIKYKNFDM